MVWTPTAVTQFSNIGFANNMVCPHCVQHWADTPIHSLTVLNNKHPRLQILKDIVKKQFEVWLISKSALKHANHQRQHMLIVIYRARCMASSSERPVAPSWRHRRRGGRMRHLEMRKAGLISSTIVHETQSLKVIWELMRIDLCGICSDSASRLHPIWAL